MRRVAKIVRAEVRAPWLIGFVLLTFVVFTREFGRLAELLIQKQADVATTGKVVVCLLPSILVFSLPFSLLIGILIGCSRLAADHEVTALRAVGAGSWQLVRPLLLYAALVSSLTALGTIVLLPRANWELRLVRQEIMTAPAHAALKPRVFFDQLPGFLLYLEDIDAQQSRWKGILAADLRVPGESRFILARGGFFTEDRIHGRVQFHFEHGSAYTFTRESPERIGVSRFRTLDLPVELPGREVREKVKRPQDKLVSELWRDLRGEDAEARRTAAVEFHRRVALAVAPWCFVLLAVGLGARPTRSGRGHGFLIGVVAAFSYYVVFATGSSLARLGTLPAWLGAWGADGLAAAVGWASLRTADRPSRLALRLANSRIGYWSCCLADRIRDRMRLVAARFQAWAGRRLHRRLRFRVRVARILDLFIARSFLTSSLAALGVCLVLVYLFTFFEIVDEVVSREIPYRIVVEYFLFLLPSFATQLAPFGVLLGTLITLGSLERTNQLTALKACGVSLYRVIMPLLAVALALTAVVFVVQEEVMPSANRRQDFLRGVIKGRPAQVSEPGDHWIFGQQGRLYRYRLFHPQLRRFADLTVLDVSLAEGKIREVVAAEVALWDEVQRAWRLYRGWSRSFEPDRFARFDERLLSVPEEPEFFGQEVRESNKMNFRELRAYIENLQLGGFEVDYLKTELYKKVSFPLLNVVMALLGIPFALTVGRKGALHGVAAGVVLGIACWGAFGVFDVLGANSLLAPALAAWGADVLFASGALFLLTSVRT
ncbi:MAG: hypothetical protein Kow00109_28370 [Acidobacteriota bacterium]